MARRGDLQAAADDPMRLNAVAWDAFESRLAMREAVVWARRAVEGSKRDPMILDTLANLLFVQGARDEAIATEKEAVEKAGAEGGNEGLRRELGIVLARMVAEDAAMDAAAKDAAGKAPAEGGAR